MRRTLRLLRTLMAVLVLLTILLLTNSKVNANSYLEAHQPDARAVGEPPETLTDTPPSTHVALPGDSGAQLSASHPDAPSGPVEVFFPLLESQSQSPPDSDPPNIVNSFRGYYRWRGEEIVPNGEPAMDAYDRYFWSDVETSHGVYDFSKIEADVAGAASRGQKFGLRIRTMKDSNSGGMYVPSYLSDCGWYNNNTFIPDWNASCFLDNAESMLQALGQRYDNDPRIAWIDIGMYGTWGEWALSTKIYDKAPSGIVPATNQALFRIVDMHLKAFPTVRKVMIAKANEHAVAHALSASDQVGWRVDCLGKPGYFDFDTNPDYDVSWPWLQNRWQTAPVITEFCSAASNGMDLSYQTAEEQVTQWHISLVSNGNTDKWKDLNKVQKENLLSLGKKAGYRYEMNNVSYPSVLVPGQPFEIAAVWENAGVAPHYESVVVKYQLYNPSTSSVVWEGESGVDLKSLLPGAPLNQVDSMLLPGDLAAGTYQLRVLVVDPGEFRRPLRLAISGLQPDGSYSLGKMTIP